MRGVIVIALLCGALVACGGTQARDQRAAATVAPGYVGIRTQGYATPGEFEVANTTATGIFLLVHSVPGTTLDAYRAAWQSDGWRLTNTDTVDGTTVLTFERAGQRVAVGAQSYANGPEEATFVVIAPLH